MALRDPLGRLVSRGELLRILKQARHFHEQLDDEANSREQRQNSAREIANLLTTFEAESGASNKDRLLLLRLRTDAAFRAGLHDAEGVRNPEEVWQHYDDLERKL